MKEQKLTLAKFKILPRGKVFATGTFPNLDIFPVNTSEYSIIYSGFNKYQLDVTTIRWVAKKGFGFDWAIYHQLEIMIENSDFLVPLDEELKILKFKNLPPKSEEEILNSKNAIIEDRGIKLFGSKISKCVPCTKKVLELYRK